MRTVLIIDDEKAVLQIVVQSLTRTGRYVVLTASDLDEARPYFIDQPPDLVLLDIHFAEGVIDGVECVRRIRQNGYEGIVCMFTGDPSPSMLFQAALAGADDYIVKSSACRLHDEVDQLIERMEKPSDVPLQPEEMIAESGFLRSRGLAAGQIQLLSDFAKLGYPRVKEFACEIGVSESGLWKRLARIREKLDMDSMTQITHLLTALSIFSARVQGSPPRPD